MVCNCDGISAHCPRLALGDGCDHQVVRKCCGVRGECRRHPDSGGWWDVSRPYLLPAAAGSHVEDPDVKPPGQQLKGSLILFMRSNEWKALGAETLEP